MPKVRYAYKDLYRMAVLATAVEKGSFSAAARKLGLGRSVVGQHIQALESNLGVRLVNRSTRSFSLTEEGVAFSEYCTAIMRTLETAFDNVKTDEADISGLIRITAPHNLGKSHMAAIIGDFCRSHPFVKMDLILDDAVLNIIENQIDLAIRVGPLDTSSVMATKLGEYQLTICSSLDFQNEHAIVRPADLNDLPWIEVPRSSIGHRPTLIHCSGASEVIKLRPIVTTNSGITAQALIESGLGIGILPDYSIQSELKTGVLVQILPDWHLPRFNISAVFLNQNLPQRVRVFLDFLKQQFKQKFPSRGEEAGWQGQREQI